MYLPSYLDRLTSSGQGVECGLALRYALLLFIRSETLTLQCLSSLHTWATKCLNSQYFTKHTKHACLQIAFKILRKLTIIIRKSKAKKWWVAKAENQPKRHRGAESDTTKTYLLLSYVTTSPKTENWTFLSWDHRMRRKASLDVDRCKVITWLLKCATETTW